MGRGVWWTQWSIMLAMVLWNSSTTQLQVGVVPAEAPEQCGAPGCTLNNAYKLWNNRSLCKAAKVVYPTTEDEIVAAVADAVRSNQKIKVATTYSHNILKVACLRTDSGVIISSKKFTCILSIDKVQNTVTAQSGITMRALVDCLASQGLGLAVAPFFDSVTLGGVIANTVYGSSLWGKGGAVHEYVLAMTLVTPASALEGYVKVRVFECGDPDLNAAKVHPGVMGVVSAVTLQVEPQLKQNMTMELVKGDGELIGVKVLEFANRNKYGEVMWYPGLRQVVYKYDN